ncbi:MAG: site-2 protease family protein, partial [Thermoleophilia bacterium]
MGSGFKIGRLFGIDIAIHSSWLIIFFVWAWSLATQVFVVEPWSTTTVWVVAVSATLLFFLSVLVHELAHSLVARAQGIPVRGIMLYLLGGVSTIESEATSPGREALMAGAGPASSL